MQIGEILRKLADIVDRDANPGQPDDKIQNPAGLEPIDDGQLPVEQPHNQDQGQDDETMVPPLQLKLELLKRAVGVNNIYDEERADETDDAPQAGEDQDELKIIRKNAGLNPAAVVISAAGDDEPLDD
jgi:hypothetical protein